MISLITAPPTEVAIPILFGRMGIFFLCIRSKYHFFSNFSFNCSNAKIREPLPTGLASRATT